MLHLKANTIVVAYSFCYDDTKPPSQYAGKCCNVYSGAS